MHRSTRMSISHQTATVLKGAINIDGIGFNVVADGNALHITGGNKDDCSYNIGPLLGVNLPLLDAVQLICGLHAKDLAEQYAFENNTPEESKENPPGAEPSSAKLKSEELEPSAASEEARVEKGVLDAQGGAGLPPKGDI